jgi:hypothetical protein
MRIREAQQHTDPDPNHEHCIVQKVECASPAPSSQPASSIIDKTQRMDQIPEWFPGSRLNYAENLLRYFGSDSGIWFGLGFGRAGEGIYVTYEVLY